MIVSRMADYEAEASSKDELTLTFERRTGANRRGAFDRRAFHRYRDDWLQERDRRTIQRRSS